MHVSTQCKGSYRASNMVDLLDKTLTPALADGTGSQVICLDWYAAHSCPDVRNLIAERGHALLMYGGGTTSTEQVGDSQFFQTFARHALPGTHLPSM